MQRTLNWKFLLSTLGIFLVVGIAMHLVHGMQIHRSAGTLLEQAERAKARGDIGQAVVWYTHYLERQPEDTDAKAELALVLDERAKSAGDWKHVAALLEEVLGRDPGRSDLRSRLVNHLIQLRRLPEAVTNLETLIAASTNKAELEHMLGWCHEALGDYDKAVAAFKRAITLDPTRQASYVLLAETLRDRLDQAEEAAAVMDALVAANGNSFRAYLARFNYARARVSALAPAADRLAEAARDLGKALELGPREVEVLLAAADWEQARGDWTKAADLLGQASAASPRNPAIIKARAGLAVRGGRRADAVAMLTAALRDVPRAYDLEILLAELLREDGRFADAAALWRRVSEEQPRDLVSRFALFEIAVHANQYDEADRLLEDLHKMEGETGKFWRFGSVVLLVHQKPEEPASLDRARRELDKLARQEKNWDRIPLLQATVEETDGNLDKAIVHYLRAIDLGATQTRSVSQALRLLIRYRRFLEGEQVLRKVEEETALAPELLRLSAEIALGNENATEAIRLASRAVSPASVDYRVYIWLGGAYHRAGADAKAEVALRHALALAPQTPDTWIALVQQSALTGQRPAAQAIADQAKVKIAPSLALFTQARCWEQMGLIDQAATAYRAGLTTQVDDFAFLAHAADFFRHADQGTQAIPFLSALINMPGLPTGYLPRARRHLALVFASKGSEHLTEALALIDANLHDQPQSFLDRRARALILARDSARRRQAIGLFEESAPRLPLTTEEELALADLWNAEGDPARAREQLLAALTRQSDNPQVLAHYVRALLADNDVDQAKVQLQKLERLEPGSSRVRDLKQKLD